jgi:hypothetical protein
MNWNFEDPIPDGWHFFGGGQLADVTGNSFWECPSGPGCEYNEGSVVLRVFEREAIIDFGQVVSSYELSICDGNLGTGIGEINGVPLTGDVLCLNYIFESPTRHAIVSGSFDGAGVGYIKATPEPVFGILLLFVVFLKRLRR